ncbi:MAG TPA: tetratricopeptide repeat protein, partial [Stellaceae bacterium]|nr:tetratricopeptide repeat protein [Stellaceae bacterium]
SVKQARREAGLSLGDVARGDISRTAIYFIETGKAKPSRETLELIAERTGRPLEFFLEGVSESHNAVRIAEVERLLVSGHNAGAVAAGTAALNRHPEPETEARLKLLVSMAHLRLAQPVVGRRLAVEARSYFERVGDLEMVAECLGNEASGAYLMEDISAQAIARGALDTVRSLKPVPRATEARLLGVLGHTHIVNREWPAAIRCYEQAIEAADVVQDLHRLSLMYSGLSLAHEELGKFEQAGRYSRRALAIHETLNDQLSLARSENNLGVLLLHAGDAGGALTHVERALKLFEDLNVETGKANVILSMSEIALARRDIDGARRYANEAMELAVRLGEGSAVTEAHYWLAQVALARGDHRTVDLEFAAALDEGAARGRERVARYRAAYAEILERRGDLSAANRQLRLALSALGAPAADTSSARTAIA